MKKQKNYEWYAQLKRPSWAPPAWLFGPVWSVLYVIIFVSFGRVWYNAFYLIIPFGLLLPFLLNLIVNFAFTPIQFRLKSNILASVDILLVLGTLIYALVHIYPYMPWVVWVNIPYVLWVAFATCLQFTITWLNRI
jgi:tryptophan-rich sensory protein